MIKTVIVMEKALYSLGHIIGKREKFQINDE